MKQSMNHIDGTAGSKQSVSLSLTFFALELNTPTGEDFLEALHSLFLDRLLASPFSLVSTWPDLRHGFLCIQLVALSPPQMLREVTLPPKDDCGSSAD